MTPPHSSTVLFLPCFIFLHGSRHSMCTFIIGSPLPLEYEVRKGLGFIQGYAQDLERCMTHVCSMD